MYVASVYVVYILLTFHMKYGHLLKSVNYVLSFLLHIMNMHDLPMINVFSKQHLQKSSFLPLYTNYGRIFSRHLNSGRILIIQATKIWSVSYNFDIYNFDIYKD